MKNVENTFKKYHVPTDRTSAATERIICVFRKKSINVNFLKDLTLVDFLSCFNLLATCW